MNKKMLTPISFIAIFVFIFIILFPVISLRSSTQDVLFTASSSEAIIGIDGMMIARGKVCLPKVKRGVHIFSARIGENSISDEFFVSDSMVIINDKQKRNKGKDQVVENDSLQLRAETTSCKLTLGE